MVRFPSSRLVRSISLGLLLLPLSSGCRQQAEEPAAPSSTEAPSAAEPVAETKPSNEPQETVIDPDALLARRLPAEEAKAGWIELFDGQSFFGWQIVGDANWRVDEGTITVDAGEPSFLATSVDWENYELQLEYRAANETNSGIFLRTPLSPQDPASDCYELNIAPPSNPFPTGSLVGRSQVDPEAIGPLADDTWHRYHVRVEGNQVVVEHDGQQVLQYESPEPVPAGRISLQHNQGKVAFRNLRLRPLGLQSLLTAADPEAAEGPTDGLPQWKRYPEMAGDFVLNDQGQLHVTGGRGQLESRQAFGDFVLLTTCRTNAPDLNSGIFFRCIPGEQMNGYECQISNATIDDSPLRPADWGTGGIFKREPARIVAAEDEQWFSLLLVATGARIATWVNGIQVNDWQDRREPDPNPRRGRRLEPGTLMLQAHDPTTDLLFGRFEVAALGDPPAQP